MFICGSMLINKFKLPCFVFYLSLIFPLLVFLGPSHLCVPDIGRFLVACWLKSWTATTYIFLCDPYTYMRQATRKKVKMKTFSTKNHKLWRLTSALVRSPILTGWMGKKAGEGWQPLVTGNSTHHHHQQPHSLTWPTHSSLLECRISLGKG